MEMRRRRDGELQRRYRGELTEVIYEGARALGARGNLENGGEEERRGEGERERKIVGGSDTTNEVPVG